MRDSQKVAESLEKGPRTEHLLIYFYGDSAAAYAGFKTGESDLMAYPLTKTQYDDAVADPNIILAPYTGLDMFEFDLNHNYTVPSYPAVKNPMKILSFRQALAHLTDKDYIVDVICGGFAERLDTPIPASLTGWWNTSVTGGNYPYPYNLAVANFLLDEDGFDDYDDDGIRNYPLDWPGREGVPEIRDESNLDPLIFYARNEDPLRFGAAELLRGEMLSVGIPVDFRVGGLTYCSPPVIGDRDYHIYTGGWSVGRFPTFLYSLYHSNCWFPWGGSNYVTDHQFLEYDEHLEGLYSAATLSEAKTEAMWCSGFHTTQVVTIPLWSTQSYHAYRNLLGVVNMAGFGIVNDYTFLNAYNDQAQPLRMGVIGEPILNVMSPMATREILDRTYDPLLAPNPYNLEIDQPWIAQDWHVDVWFDNETGEDKTVVTFWLKTNTTYDAYDVDLTVWYLKGCHPSLDHVKYSKVIDAYTIEIYMDSLTYWGLYSIGELPILRAPDTFYGEYGVNKVTDGMYYPTYLDPTVGGIMEFKRNPYYWMETPPLGELDWKWYWVGTEKPRGGYCQIDIYDIVTAAGAYGSQGSDVPSPKWNVGADVAPPSGKIDIYDIVTECARYGRRFWEWIKKLFDFDGDGILNHKDIDDDNDGVPDYQDNNPQDPNRSRDTDNDGTDDTADNDIDGDGTANDADWDDDGDGNSDAFEERMKEKRQLAYQICNQAIDEALKAQEKMNKQGDAIDDGGDLGGGTQAETQPFGPNTGETSIDTEDNDADPDGDPDKPGEQDGTAWSPEDADEDGDRDQCDLVRVIVHEARHAWQMELRGRSEKELGRDLDGDKTLEDDVRENDKDGDGLPDKVPPGTGANDIEDDDGGTTPDPWNDVAEKLEDDAYDFEKGVPSDPWW
jgi:hypothetical protein